ncbi:hypothetical protein B0I35DRAFT_182278 [Stachybotrys elegans]|uniref:Uncharacterized protein n=1 Tax=Stachybotrys elegans TaxID=80388 RepID=A0A8K0WSG9_9HYPO|nr:hypothetical protein B0I35DRAFT_182278 [Stachybotrys elegans]
MTSMGGMCLSLETIAHPTLLHTDDKPRLREFQNHSRVITTGTKEPKAMSSRNLLAAGINDPVLTNSTHQILP